MHILKELTNDKVINNKGHNRNININYSLIL